MALPTESDLTGVGTTNAQQKVNLAGLRNFIANIFGTVETKAAVRTALGAGATGDVLFRAATAAEAYNAVVFSQSMVRLNTANGYGSTNTAIRRFSNIVTNVGPDITYTDSATLGSTFTINTAGVYAVSYVDNFNAISVLGVSLNSAQLTTGVAVIAVADKLTTAVTTGPSSEACAAWTGYLPAGSVLRPHASATPTGTNDRTVFTIVRVA